MKVLPGSISISVGYARLHLATTDLFGISHLSYCLYGGKQFGRVEWNKREIFLEDCEKTFVIQ